jgi:hypothetical protein
VNANPQRYSRANRAEWLVLLVALALLGLRHVREIEWPRFGLAFALIDLVGYLPGAIAFRRAGGGGIAAVFHHLYNVMHSFVTHAGIGVVWALVAGGPEWAMLAIPIHLAGDRGLFGNGFKPVGSSFEPAPRAQTPSLAEDVR